MIFTESGCCYSPILINSLILKENKYIANYERIVTVSIAGGWIME
nr:MAG TPA: hypothetical protein [Caudoviricetes sp.]